MYVEHQHNEVQTFFREHGMLSLNTLKVILFCKLFIKNFTLQILKFKTASNNSFNLKQLKTIEYPYFEMNRF